MSESYEKKIAKDVLKGTINQLLIFKTTKSTLSLTGFCDADWANSQDRKGITGYGFMISDEGPLICGKHENNQQLPCPRVRQNTCLLVLLHKRGNT